MSLRVSQPLRSVSDHACPNWPRSEPVRGALPLTGRAASAASAVPGRADGPRGAGATVGLVVAPPGVVGGRGEGVRLGVGGRVAGPELRPGMVTAAPWLVAPCGAARVSD